MKSGQSVEDWARGAKFAQPLQWGEVESTVLAWDISRSEVETPLNRAIGLVALAGVWVLGMVTGGAPLVALVLIVIGATWDKAGAAGGWFPAALFLFCIAVVIQLSNLHQWWTTRRHQLLDLLTTCIASEALARQGHRY